MIQCDPCLMPKLMYFWFATKYQIPQHFTMSKINGCLKFDNIGIMPLLFYADVKMTLGVIRRSYPASVNFIYLIILILISLRPYVRLVVCHTKFALIVPNAISA